MRRFATLLAKLFAFTVCASTTALAAKQSPPAVAAPRAFATPAPYTFELANGLKATFIEFGRVPKVTLQATVRVGDLNKGDKPWLPQMTAEFLKEGARNHSASEIAFAAADMGGAISISVDSDTTNIETDALSESSVDALHLLADMLIAPNFPAAQFDRIRQDYLRRLSVARTQAQTLADNAFEKLLYGKHPYGSGLPTESDLKSLTIDDVKKFYAANFGAQRTHIYVAGRFERAAMERAIRDAFDRWQRGPDVFIDPPPAIDKLAAHKIKVALIDRPGAEQSTLLLGLRVIDVSVPNFTALSVTNTLLGGSLTSRVTSNLREEKGWAYSPDSSLNTHVDDAVWVQSADVATAHTAESLHEIFAEINKLRANAPSDNELQAVKRYRDGVFVLSNATANGLLNQVVFMDLHRLPPDWLSTYVPRLFAITPFDVAQAATLHLDPRKMSLAVVGDMKAVGKQIKSLPELANAEFIDIKP